MKKMCLLIAVLCAGAILPLAASSDHSFFPVYNVNHLATTGGDTYDFYSLGFNYTYNARRKFGLFSSLSVLFPTRSNQNGETFKNSDYYKSMLSIDLMVGAGSKLPAGERVTFVPSLGLHINGIRLRGKDLYRDFTNLTTGIGTNVQARYAISRSIEGITFVSGSWDFIDLIHTENQLKNGLACTVGMGLTF